MAISKIELPNGVIYDLEEEGDFYVYSTVDIQAGCNDREISFFNYDESDQVAHSQDQATAPLRDASERDTNNTNKGTMGDDESFSIFSIRNELQESAVDSEEDDGSDDAEAFTGLQPLPALANVARLNRIFVLRLNLQGLKPYERHHLSFFSAGYGPDGYVVAAAASSASFGRFGVASHAGARRIAIPHIIAPTMVYEMLLSNPAGKTLVLLRPDGTATSAVGGATNTTNNIQARMTTTILGPRLRQVGRHMPVRSPVQTGAPGAAQVNQ